MKNNSMDASLLVDFLANPSVAMLILKSASSIKLDKLILNEIIREKWWSDSDRMMV